jgi:hypothetical protein
MSNQKFIKINNKLCNTKYIKEIECDDNKCSIVFANTKTGFGRMPYISLSSSPLSQTYDDYILECHKRTSPHCYENIVNFINRHDSQNHI